MIASTKEEKVADLVATFKSTGRIVIVGASLAGLRAAEALRKEGFTGGVAARRGRRSSGPGEQAGTLSWW